MIGPILSWNVRGFGTSRGRLKNLVRKLKPKIVALMEPFASSDKVQDVIRFLHMDKFITNDGEAGKIWVLWQDDISVQPILCKEQYILIRVGDGDTTFICCFVYAKCNMVERREVWESLNGQTLGNEPCIVVGDFNIIREDSERRGGKPRPRMAMEDFNNWIENCGLMDMKSSGRRFSWCNGQRGLSHSWAKLDRGLLNASCLTRFPNVNNSYLSRSTSDHSPMFIQFQSELFLYGPSLFRFQQMWIEHPDFHEFVGSIWKEEVGGMGLLKLAFKLKKLRGALREWNKCIFGRTEAHIQGLEIQIEEFESELQQEWDPRIEQELVLKNMELANWRRREETRLAQMAKVKWCAEGDQNSSFFHAYLFYKSKKRVTEMRLQD